MDPLATLFEAASLRAIDRVGGTHDQGSDAAGLRIPAERTDDFVAALQDELGAAWQVRWAGAQHPGILYAEHLSPAGITHVRFTDSTVDGRPMKELTYTHYY